MSQTILIYGESGAGKSTSIRTLKHEETFVINVLGKPLPFKGWKNKYIIKDKENKGNMIATDRSQNIVKILAAISKDLPYIKNIIIDDFQYVMANEFMSRALEKGYEKFSEIGQNAWNIIMQASSLREDIKVFFLSHSETNETTGKTKIKTIGRMLDEKVCLEGMFTIVLFATVVDNRYCFCTQSCNNIVAKSPHEMFADKIIENDLSYVAAKIDEYEKEQDISYRKEEDNIATIKTSEPAEPTDEYKTKMINMVDKCADLEALRIIYNNLKENFAATNFFKNELAGLFVKTGKQLKKEKEEECNLDIPQ
jgi:energy-coupling factor transporter ATP-binding protein EcfA2